MGEPFSLRAIAGACLSQPPEIAACPFGSSAQGGFFRRHKPQHGLGAFQLFGEKLNVLHV
jgi:hypothetical protein